MVLSITVHSVIVLSVIKLRVVMLHVRGMVMLNVIN
jgi:hypothetical protein